MTIEAVVARGNIGRNAKCPCGSGKKYKKCCRKPLPFQPHPIIEDYPNKEPEHEFCRGCHNEISSCVCKELKEMTEKLKIEQANRLEIHRVEEYIRLSTQEMTQTP